MKHTLIFFMALLILSLAELSTEDELMLTGDWLPDDPHQIDYEKLPRVKAKHVVISDVRDHAGTRVHQHAYLAHHDGRFWAMWSDGPGEPRAGATPGQHRNIVPGHDMPGTRNSFATSQDGLREVRALPEVAASSSVPEWRQSSCDARQEVAATAGPTVPFCSAATVL